MSGIEIFFHLAYPKVVHEDVADHQDQPLPRGKLEKSKPLLHFGRQRLFDQHMLTSLERFFCQRVVSTCGRGDDNGVDSLVAQCLLGIFPNLHIGKPSLHLVQSSRIAVDDPDHFARLLVVKIPNEVRPPLASPNHRHPNHCHPRRRRFDLPNCRVRAARKPPSAPGHRSVNRSRLFRLTRIFTAPPLPPECAGDGRDSRRQRCAGRRSWSQPPRHRQWLLPRS